MWRPTCFIMLLIDIPQKVTADSINEPPFWYIIDYGTFVFMYTIMKVYFFTEFFLNHHFYGCWLIDSREIMICRPLELLKFFAHFLQKQLCLRVFRIKFSLFKQEVLVWQLIAGTLPFWVISYFSGKMICTSRGKNQQSSSEITSFQCDSVWFKSRTRLPLKSET